MTHDKTITKIARSTALPASLLGGLLATATLSAEMDRATWSDEDNYLLMMSHMPDFDQRRGGQNGLRTNQTIGGGTHCGPTSCANLLAYIATHGFPQVDPGSADYAQTGSQAIYDRATELIRDLGVEMNVDTWVRPNGTRGRGTTMNGQRNAMQARLSESFTLNSFRRHGDHGWWPDLGELARAGADNGAIMTVDYGYYDWTGDDTDGYSLNQRNGGHTVTLAVAAGFNGTKILGVSDPTTESGESTLTQSDFELSLWYVDDHPVVDGSGTLVNANFLRDNDSASTDGSSDRVLEGYIMIQPRTGLSWGEHDTSFFVLGPTREAWMEAIGPERPSGPTFSRIRDLQFDPDMIDPILLDEDTRSLVRFPIGSAMPEPIKLEREDGRIDAFAIDRHRNLLVFSGTSIRRYGFDAPAAPTFGANMPAPVTAVDVNDERDEIMVLMGGIGYVGKLTGMHTSRPRLRMKRLPRTANWNDASGILQLDADTVLITMDGGGVHKLEDRGRSMSAVPFELEGLPGDAVTSAAIDDQGALLVAAAGQVNAYRPLEDGGFKLDPGHLFHGMDCGERFLPSTSRTNLDDSDLPEKNNELGDRPSTWILKRCRGDVNWDQRVDERDVNMVLQSIGNTRGAEDINRDGIVNVLDIVAVTSSIGECN